MLNLLQKNDIVHNIIDELRKYSLKNIIFLIDNAFVCSSPII